MRLRIKIKINEVMREKKGEELKKKTNTTLGNCTQGLSTIQHV